MAKAFSAVAGKALRTAAGRADSREAMIKAVRAACRRLGIDDDDRRALQLEETGHRSMSDMTLADFGKMLDRLNKGWRGPMGHRGHVGKIKALWWSLYWLSAIDDPSPGALDSFVERQTDKQRLNFLGPREAFKVIEALRAWLRREGVAWPAQARLDELLPANPGLTLARLERHAVLEAIGDRLQGLGLVRDRLRYLERAIGLGCNHWAWTERDLDACIRELGKKLRRALDKAGGE